MPNPNPHWARLALPPEFFVGTLIIVATGTRLNTITLISASPYSQKSLKSSPAISFSSIIILSHHSVIEYFPSRISNKRLLNS